MEKVRKISKRYYVRQIVSCWLVWWMAFGLPLRVAMATPDGGVFQVGTGTIIDGVVGGDNTVVVNQMESVIHWGSPGSGGIDTSSSESLSFSQGVLSNSAVLNRIMSNNTTQFDGALNGVDMRIFIVNPAGVIFGHGASVNVNQLVASGLPMTNDDFLTAVTNPSEKMVFGPGSGDVTIEGTLDADGTGSLYFVGENVFNNGAIICPDGLVVMAAGDEMLLGQPGSDVIVALGDLTADENNDVENNGTVGGSSVDKLVLAAGDVWSQAISNVKKLKIAATESAVIDGEIYAYAESASDAVADVTIITGGDFTVDDEIMAEAEADGGGDNAFASVTIESTGGSVTVNDLVKAEADAEDGAGNATATVDILADGNVDIFNGSEGEDVQADVWVDENSGNGEATVNIDAGGYVNINDEAEVKAEADTRDNSGNAAATTGINATGDIDIYGKVRARAEAVDSGNATANNNITGQNIVIQDTGDNHEIITRAITNSNNVNTGDALGNTVITARGDLTVDGAVKTKVQSNDAGNATSDIDISGVNIDINGSVVSRTQAGFIDNDGTEYSDGDSGDATSSLDITGTGVVNVNNVVRSSADAEYNSGSASATTNITGTDLNITGGGGGDNWSVSAEAETEEYSGNATADVEIEATTGDVMINSGGYPVIAEAEVENPDNEYTGDSDAGVTITAGGDVETWDLIKAEADAQNGAGDATATVDITADGSVTVHNGEYDYMVQADVWVNNNSGSGDATLNITALGGDVDIYGDVKSEAETSDNSGNATAELNISASGDVLIDENEGDTVKAKASVEESDNEYTGDATATVDIVAEGDVTIDDNVIAEAETEGDDGTAGDSEAGVTITAGGDVEIYDQVKAEADAENSAGDATATVDITADGSVTVHDGEWDYMVQSDVWVNENSGSGEATLNITALGGDVDIYGDVKSEAETSDNSGNATATLDISASGDVSIYENEGDTVIAVAEVDNPDNEYEGDATATLGITAGGDLDIYDQVKAEADAEDGAGDATATVDITAGGTVTIHEPENGENYMVQSDVWVNNNSGSGDATLNITALGGDVEIYDDIKAEAETSENSGNAAATLDISASGDVIIAESEGDTVKAKAEVDDPDNEYDGDATANLSITAGGDVVVEDDVEAKAETDGDAGDATATLDIDAGGDVTVDNGSEVGAEADAYNGSGNAAATVDVIADGDVLVDGGGEGTSYLWSYAYTDDSGDATAETTVTADNVTVIDDGDIEAYADAYNGSGNATATTEITTTGSEVLVEDDSYIYSYAETDNDAGDATARTTVIAGDVTVIDSGEIYAEADAYYGSGNATATVDIDATGDVLVEDSEEPTSYIWSDAYTYEDSGDATAETTVTADNVTVTGSAEIYAEAGAYDGSGNAAATVDIDADGDVLVEGGDESTSYIWSYAYTDDSGHESGNATATVDIDASGNVTVDDGEITAETEVDNGGGSLYSGDATATVDIVAGGDVTVDEDSEIEANADIDNDDDGQINTYTGNADADVYITTPGQVTVDGLVKARADIDNQDDYEEDELPHFFPGDTYSGSAYANVTIDNRFHGGDGVTVGPEGEILAMAEIIIYDHWSGTVENNVYSGNANAGIDIQTCGSVIVDGLIKSEGDFRVDDIWTFNDDYSGKTEADVIIKAYGDVIVNSEDDEENGSNGRIEALASDGVENSAAITILAVGDVIVNDGSHENGYPGPFLDSPEEITAVAQNGPTNNAFLGIATREGFGGNVEVSGQISARARNWEWPQYGLWEYVEEGTTQTNTSNVEICADQDLIVYGGFADIEYYVPVEDPIQYDVEGEEGGQIMAAARGRGFEGEPVSFNNASVDIFAGRDVIVHGAEIELTEVDDPIISPSDDYFDGGQIYATTAVRPLSSYSENTTHVGIYAQRDVTIHDATITGEPPEELEPPFPIEIDGWVWSGARGNWSINTADVEICAQDDVTVDGLVEAIAKGGNEGQNHAHIRIAAGDEIAGSGEIAADADDASITFYVTSMDNFNFTGTMMPEEPEFEVGPVDCPDCEFEWIDWSWCEDCEESRFFDPPPITWLVPPFDEPVEFGPGGCPLLMMWLADELGVGVDIQVVVANAYAYSTDCQPCDAAARLQEAARILADEDGAHLAAMLAVFSELAPTDAPFTPEMGTAIATAFSGAAEGSQYASAAEYVDAFVQYIAILDTELGSPVEDSVAFVMGTYGTGITEGENNNLAAFVATRMEAGETFAP